MANEPKKPRKTESFGVQQYLSNAGVSRRIVKFKKGQVIYSQDDPCDDVLYIQSGNAKVSIVNTQGKEAVLAIVGPGDFLGEGCIIGNPVRMATATAIAPLNAMIIEKQEMMRVLHIRSSCFSTMSVQSWITKSISLENISNLLRDRVKRSVVFRMFHHGWCH